MKVERKIEWRRKRTVLIVNEKETENKAMHITVRGMIFIHT